MAAEPQTPAAPPNLRASAGEDRECEVCTYFQHGHCTKFPPLVVSPEWLCDDFKKGSQSDEDSSSPPPSTLKGAGAKARAMLRAAQQ